MGVLGQWPLGKNIRGSSYWQDFSHIMCDWWYSFILTHRSRVAHICVGKVTIIGSDNGLSYGQRQAIIWINAGRLLIESFGINFSEIVIEIYTLSFKKIHLKMLSAICRQFCLGPNVRQTVKTATARKAHYDDVIMTTLASQITSLAIVYSIVYSDADQRKHQSSASLAFVRGIHRGPVNSPHKWPVTRKMFPFDDVIMIWIQINCTSSWMTNLVIKYMLIHVLGRLPEMNILKSLWHSASGNGCCFLTHWGRDKMAAIFQTIFRNGFSWMKMHQFCLRFHWSLFLRFELMIFQHCIR